MIHMKWLCVSLAIVGTTLGAPMREALEPKNVAVVINEDSWASVAVADAYVRLRGIPPGNVIRLGNLPGFETISVDDFRALILAPVFAAIQERGLKDAIDCIAYSSDIPYEVGFHGDLGSNQVPPEVGDQGSLTGMTYLHEAVAAKAYRAYASLNSNRYARRAFVDRPESPLSDDEATALREVDLLLHEKKSAAAAKILSALCNRHPGRPLALYNLACCLAVDGQTDAAGDALDRAVKAGWWDAAHASRDPDLEPLRALPAYAALRARMEQNRLNLSVGPTLPFRSRIAWDMQGQPGKAESGPRYMLSVMLGVTSGRGTSVREAVAALERAAASDGTRPAGSVYYMVNDDIRSRTRRWGFEAAVRLLTQEGVAAVIADGSLPQKKLDIAGAMVGVPTFDFVASGSRILPGAICEHLTSTGGTMVWDGGQTALTEFLRHGAAGSSGTVTEPYAIQAKFPDPFIHVHYARGASLAEAFYQSVAAPYQLLIVGDPLCRPWGPARGTPGLPEPLVKEAPVKADPMLDPAALRRGLRVVCDGQSKALNGAVGPQPWSTAGIARGATITVEGFVEARTNDIYQFQVLSDGNARVDVAGRPLAGVGKGRWQTFPVPLEKGWHAVTLSLTAGGAGGTPWAGEPLDLRFGAAGVPPLAPQMRYRPRQGDAIRYTGLVPRVLIDGMTDDPLSIRMRFALDGLDEAVGGSVRMTWKSPDGSGWSIEPASAEARIAKGVCEPAAFQVLYSGAPFASNAFFTLPVCHLDVRTGSGNETTDPVTLPLERIMKDRPRPAMDVPRVPSPPRIDGVLDDAAWACPANVTGLLRPQLDRPAAQATRAWLAWDDHGLYFAARCAEPEKDKLRLKSRQRDDPTYGDDSIELFLAPDVWAKPYYQIVVNAAGVVYDSREQDASWNGDLSVAVGREAGGWTVELAVPWASLGAERPKAGAKIRVLVARNRRAAGASELSLWPFISGGNHQPNLFAEGVLKAGGPG